MPPINVGFVLKKAYFVLKYSIWVVEREAINI
jgi:hypothetical protein